MFDADKTVIIGLPYGEKKVWPYVTPFSSDIMLTRDKNSRVCRIQQCNSTDSAAVLRMEIKHVATYYFLRTIKGRVDLRGLYAKVHQTLAHV